MKSLSLLVVMLFFCSQVFSQENACPKINLIVPEMLYPEQPAAFSIEIEGDKQDTKRDYFWMFSGGKIIKGRGTSAVEFEAGENDNGNMLGVAVKVRGLPDNCPDTVSKIALVASIPGEDPLDDFGKSSLFEFMARISSFTHALNQDSNYTGLLEIVFNKEDSRKYKISYLQKLSNVLAKYKNVSSRIMLAITQSDHERTISWIMPPSARYPKSRGGSNQWITEKTHQIIKADEIKRKISLVRF